MDKLNIDPEVLLLLRQFQTQAGPSNLSIATDENNGYSDNVEGQEVDDHRQEVEDQDFSEWSDEIFVEEIKKYRCLWDTSSRAYKDGPKKQQSWKELSQKFKREGESLKKLWKNLRDNFSKCFKKRELMTRSGAAAGKLPKCKLFDQMMFIRDTVANRPTISNINIEEATSFNGSFETTPPESPACSTPFSEKESVGLRKRKSEKDIFNKCDAMLIEALKNDGERKEKKVFDPDVSFAESIVPILQKLPDKKNRKAKIEIQQILMKYEFDE